MCSFHLKRALENFWGPRMNMERMICNEKEPMGYGKLKGFVYLNHRLLIKASVLSCD